MILMQSKFIKLWSRNKGTSRAELQQPEVNCQWFFEIYCLKRIFESKGFLDFLHFKNLLKTVFTVRTLFTYIYEFNIKQIKGLNSIKFFSKPIKSIHINYNYNVSLSIYS